MNGEQLLPQPTVLIVADDAEFSRAVMARWQTERSVPDFTLVSSEVWNSGNSAAFELAIVRSPAARVPLKLLEGLDAIGKPVIYVCDDATALHAVREKLPRVLALREYEGWLDSLVLVAGEALRRSEAVARAREAEETIAHTQRDAMLGRYMLEMRHGLN